MPNLQKLQQWLLYTAHGKYTLLNETKFYQNAVHNVFGYYSLQIGLPELNFLNGNKINNHYVIGKDIKCNLFNLPFETNSVDLIVCPHALEFMPNYELILNEFQRVLIPRGKLVITVFNSSSFFGHQIKNNEYLNNATPIKLNIIKKQLNNLHFSIQGGKFLGYCPIVKNEKTLSRLGFIDKIGDRWFPTLANSFGLVAVKNIATFIKIKKQPQSYQAKPSPILGTAKICQK